MGYGCHIVQGRENTVTESTATSAKDGIELKAGFTLLAADETIEQRISAEVEKYPKDIGKSGGNLYGYYCR